MTFQIAEEHEPVGDGKAVTVFRMTDSSGSVSAAISPSLGFNCFSWQVRLGRNVHDILYSEKDFLQTQNVTGNGNPVLFPFPNRIRGGRFSWNNVTYSIPPNDHLKKNAIHGFVCRRPWRIERTFSDAETAGVVGVFQASVDAPEVVKLWPADFVLRLGYFLSRDSLRLQAEVVNPDRVPLPFGLGYHPYFTLPQDGTILVPARRTWVLEDLLPTGEIREVDPRADMNFPRVFREVFADDVLTDLPSEPVGAADGSPLVLRAKWCRTEGPEVTLLASPDFRESVVYVPGHRHAFCVEPYTCTTDAINLQQQGVDAGLRVLPPGQSWRSEIVMKVR